MSKQYEDLVLRKYSRSEIGDFAFSYAYLPFNLSLRECVSDHRIGIDSAKAMIVIAISHCIVDDEVVNTLEKKAVLSAYHHEDIQQLAISSIRKQYRDLRERRKNFTFSDEKAVELIVKYASSPLSKKDFCKSEDITSQLFDRTLVRGISNCLVDDAIVDSLQAKSYLYSSNPSSVEKLYQTLSQARSKYRETHQNI